MSKVEIQERLHKIQLPNKQRVLVKQESVRVLSKGTIGPSGSTNVKYIPVRAANYVVDLEDLIAGVNILGIDFNSPVTITIPDGLSQNRLIAIRDETGNASPITIQTL